MPLLDQHFQFTWGRSVSSDFLGPRSIGGRHLFPLIRQFVVSLIFLPFFTRFQTTLWRFGMLTVKVRGLQALKGQVRQESCSSF